jgi:hypothetical protein
VPLHDVEAAVAVGDGDLFVGDLEAADRPGRNVLDPGDGDESVLHGRRDYQGA